ncbi:MAG: protein-L-isoaspartate(D-aspartate) O-methyltransferase [Gemmataceae bacterium]|nr:protein-L-isoaspartate(D-aspartate) O-methyltransferase [Gemmataceae bacterium]
MSIPRIVSDSGFARARLRQFLCAAILSAGGCTADPTPNATTPTQEKKDSAAAKWDTQRRQMVEEQLMARKIKDAKVLQAMGRVPRHEFVPEDCRDLAYRDGPLPIGQGQTISQPYIVALMTEAAAPKPGQKMLEVGTGSGYQAAILADLGVEVYSIELLPKLAEEAATRLKRLGYAKVQTRTGDGYLGWPEAAPFDAVVVTCGADHVPAPLFEQLKPGGVLVIPVGKTGDQVLRVITKGPKGEKQVRELGPVRFVPLRRPGDMPE